MKVGKGAWHLQAEQDEGEGRSQSTEASEEHTHRCMHLLITHCKYHPALKKKKEEILPCLTTQMPPEDIVPREMS